MKNKITILFAALMMTLGVCAQEGSTVEQRGAEKGYYPFAAKITGKEKLTSLDQIEDNMEIMIERDGSYLTIYSLPTYGAAHTVFMQTKPVGVGVWTTKIVDANAGTFQLKSAHMMIIGGDAKCYLGQLDYNSQDKTYLSTTGIDSNIGTYKFVPAEDDSGKWKIQCAFNSKDTYLAVDNSNKISEETDVKDNCYFNVYKVTSKSSAQVKYVEASVRLTGQGGNTIVGTHQGWNDFYEFYMSGDAYGCNVSNIYYNEATNTITGDIDFPFPVSGNYVEVPVYLHPGKDANNRLAVVDDKLTTITGETGDDNQYSQWYIKPRIVGLAITYALYNIGAQKYISFEENVGSTTIGLSDTPYYFKLDGSDNHFFFKYLYRTVTDQYGKITESFLHLSGTTTIKGDSWTGQSGAKYTVSTVTSVNTDLGITQKFPQGMSFWNGGIVPAGEQPDAFNAYWTGDGHEFNSASTSHEVYCAETAIVVNSRSNVTVTFNWNNGDHKLTIFGVDLLNDKGVNILNDYHLGYAGDPNFNNVYTLENVPAGDHTLRYYVCHTPEMVGETGHNLNNTTGTITVDGATFRFKYSDAPQDGNWADNTTWYYMLLKDGYGHVCAEPAYTDWNNKLKLNNGTASSSSAALWCIVGDAKNGYKFYNRAWGPEYAMTTTGSDGGARTFMTTAAEATTYDILQHETDKNIYVKVRGDVTGNYLNKNGDYLGTWTSGASYGDSGSRVYFNEVHDVTPFDDGLPPVVEKLKKEWAPWTGDGANADINNAYANNSTFASWVLGRQQLAELLNGKVFKFANKGTDVRKDMLLTVNGEGKGAGLTATGKSEDYMQFIDNGNGTFKLFHIATARYLGVPDGAVTTTKSSEAAAYTYTFQDAAHKEQLTFQTSGQTLHLQNQNNYIFMNHGDNDDASRWIVSYGEVEAQELGAVAIKAQEMLERITTDEYLANAGQPGYASQELIEEYKTTIQGLSGMTEVVAKETLEAAMQKIKDAEYIHQYVTALTKLSNTGIYGIHCARGPLAVEGNSSTQLSTPKLGSTEDITANVVANKNEQFAILRTDNTPAGWYYLYNITTQKFVSKDFTLTENPVCAVNFRDISGDDADYRWEVWFGGILNGEKVDDKLNVNQGEGLALDKYCDMDEGNKFRIEYAETNEAKTAPALALIIALETAKAEATVFLNDTPETVGYPVADERTKFANAIVAAASVAEVAEAKTAFVTTSNIVMPENGKAYKISAWWRGRTLPLTYVTETKVDGLTVPAYVPTENATDENVSVFVCRKLDDGTYAFVTDNGNYFGWQTDNASSNGTSTTYSDATHWMVEKAVTGNNTGDLKQTELLGKLLLRANGTAAGVKDWFAYMYSYSSSSKHFHNAGANDLYYGDDAHTVYYTFEEVKYTLNKVTLTAISESDELINGLEGAIGTFSAPYATVIPEGVTAYYAKETSTNAENSSAILEEVGEDAIPAGKGVILVGDDLLVGDADKVEVVMLPATSESQATLENNYLIGTGATPVVMKTGDFILADGDQGIGFYQATGTLRAGKAYIQFGGAVNSLVLRFGGNTTDIDAVTTVTPSNDELIYDIYGRRVTEVKKGNIYIKNGKKFIVK